MGRYLKYLEVVNKIDTTLEKLISGKVDINKDLPKLKMLLDVQEKALCMSQRIDRIDDNVKSTAKLFAMGDPSAQEVVEAVMQKMKEEKESKGAGGLEGESSKGKDFRSGHQDTEARSRTGSGYSASSWPEEGRSYADEEDRRGVKGTGRYSRYRNRSEMDNWDDEEDRHRSTRTGRFVRGDMNEGDFFYPFMTPFGRMGYTGNAGEANAPYNAMNGIQVPLQNTNGNTSNRTPIQGTPANNKPANATT